MPQHAGPPNVLPDRVTTPWSVQLELVEGCTRLCSFCGLNAIRSGKGNYKHMTIATAERVAQQCAELAPRARYEFAMHGEPLVHPQALEIFSLFRAYLPRAAHLQVTTNGVSFKNHMYSRVEAIFSAGIDFIILDTYYPERDQLREDAFQLRAHGISVLDFYTDLPPDTSPWRTNHKFERTVILMDDLAARDGEVKSRVIVNHAGNNPSIGPTKEPLMKVCTLPFRELSVAWNGNVLLCCQDWGHQYVCGNATTRTLRDIWYGPEFQAARKVLYQRDRRFSPCNRCNMGSGHRAGFLPKLPAPDVADFETINRVHRHSPANNGVLPHLDPAIVPGSDMKALRKVIELRQKPM